jgi:hypothetical protein
MTQDLRVWINVKGKEKQEIMKENKKKRKEHKKRQDNNRR